MPLDHATEFALSFTADAVHLLRREPDGADQPWQSLGSADFASASFRADLAALRARASDPGLQGQDLPVVLLIPQDQILYTSLSVPLGPEREAAVGQALDGLTPYDIEELAFDWTDEGADVRVAAVARQTLVEAREFAERHGFASFGYSALPEDGEYPGMPVFGLPDDAEHALPDAISLDLDADLPDEFADEAGFRPRDDHDDPAAVTNAETDDDPDADHDADHDAGAQAEDITDVSFTELSAAKPSAADELAADAATGVDEGDDQSQPVLSGLDLPEQAVIAEAEAEDEQSGDQPAPDGDQAELFGATDDQAPAQDATRRDDTPNDDFTGAAPNDDGSGKAEEALAAAEGSLPLDPDTPLAPQAEPDQVHPDAGTTDVARDGDAPDRSAAPDLTADAVAPAALASTEIAADAGELGSAPQDLPARGAAASDDASTETERAARVTATDMAAAGTARTRLRAEPSQRVGANGGAGSGAGAAPTVVRHGPPQDAGGKARGAGVKPDKPAAKAATKSAAAAASASPATRQAAKGGGLVELIAMLGALIVGLLLVWAFIVPRDNLSDMPQLAEGSGSVEADSSQAVPADTGPAQGRTDITPPADLSSETEQAALPEAAPEGASASRGADASDDGQPVPNQTDPNQTATSQPAMATDMTDQAATGASSGPVAPNPAALPQPSASAEVSAPVMSAEEQALAVALATSAADMIARPPAPRAQPQAVQPEAAPNAAPANRAEASRLSSSARPLSAPRRQATAPVADAPPAVPDNPLPLDTVQRQTPRPSGVRPPRPSVRASAPAPAAVAATPVQQQQQAAPRPSAPAVSSLRSSSRPPARPEGAAPELQDERLSPAEQSHLDQFLRQLQQADRRGRDLAAMPLGETYRLAENRPQRRPSSGGAASAAAVESAVRSAVDSDPPSSRPGSASTVPARDSGGLLRSSNRPRGKPAGRSATASTMNDSAVTQAIAEAVSASTATPGAVALSALTSSNLPPRRSAGSRAAADSAAGNAPDAPAAAAAPDTAGASEAQQAERRRLDEQLQSQAEARIRARAQADAAAEAQARAQAEARARAQVAAEERAAAARRQTYKPQELDDEPEVAQAVQGGGVTAASVAAAATQRRGIDLGRTTIIGIVGAGQASRALIRLRNGKIVTVRLGDRIDGGTINSIGGGKITYVKSGRQHELRLLDGR